MTIALRVIRVTVRELFLLFAAGALGLLAAGGILRLIEFAPTTAPTPTLIASSIEVTLAEVEGEPRRETTPTPPTSTAVPAEALQADYLVDTSAPFALPDSPTREALRLTPPEPPPPLLPNQAPAEATLPEITLPPAKASTGATARITHPRLVTDLSRLLKRYPPEARRNHWEGTVVLNLKVAADGTLAAAEVAHSSGYEVLDRAALKMIRSARFQGGPGELQQAIQYRLR